MYYWQASDRIRVGARQAQLNDIGSILQVEKSWGEAARADKTKFIARIEKFPQGFFIAFDQAGQRPVATITSCPIHYSFNDIDQMSSWDSVTHRGYFKENLLPENPINDGENALYICSGVIDEEYRGVDIFAPMVECVVECAQQLGLRYVLAGAVIPGYKRYCERHGNISAAEYVFMRKGKHLIDPLLSMYERIGFSVPHENHVRPEYFPDDASLNHAAIVVRDLAI